ncbi:ABC-type transport system, permease component [Alteracholeplasma palmae J233]|uniref:ABC-type transport system, permease component n=1 Tax=Alteracholeplasma palmae (strain ATCC 49389 / J233) TaxID=1318466 RepID=U4KQ76_ALTPJ|nr:ABC transporter permease [Alteracholeplasma palmae]CCV64430.1 ABC-type transport system, permease component [Alteracholeplasma palmae J233]
MNEKFKKAVNTINKNLLKLFTIIKPSLIAIGIGLLIGFIIMLVFNPAGAFPGLIKMLSGGLGIGMKGVGDVIVKATPIILTGISLVVAFKSGLFNIGTPGQMIIGGYVAVHIGVLWNLPSGIHWIVALILGTLAGAIWGAIPGILKAFTNTNEVVSSIMLNYIGTLLVVFLVKTNVYNVDYAKSLNIKASAELPKLKFLFGSSDANIGIFIAIIVGILIYYLFKKTTLGYELKASGFNPDASKYAGMNAKKSIISSMTIAGGIAGLAGAINYLVIGTNLGTTYDLLPAGFDGISVALIGLTNPIGSIFSGLFLSHIRQGGFYMQINGYPPQIIDIIISVIVYTISISIGLQMIFKRLKDKRMKKTVKEEN